MHWAVRVSPSELAHLFHVSSAGLTDTLEHLFLWPLLLQQASPGLLTGCQNGSQQRERGALACKHFPSFCLFQVCYIFYWSKQVTWQNSNLRGGEIDSTCWWQERQQHWKRTCVQEQEELFQLFLQTIYHSHIGENTKHWKKLYSLWWTCFAVNFLMVMYFTCWLIVLIVNRYISW